MCNFSAGFVVRVDPPSLALSMHACAEHCSNAFWCCHQHTGVLKLSGFWFVASKLSCRQPFWTLPLHVLPCTRSQYALACLYSTFSWIYTIHTSWVQGKVCGGWYSCTDLTSVWSAWGFRQLPVEGRQNPKKYSDLLTQLPVCSLQARLYLQHHYICRTSIEWPGKLTIIGIGLCLLTLRYKLIHRPASLASPELHPELALVLCEWKFLKKMLRLGTTGDFYWRCIDQCWNSKTPMHGIPMLVYLFWFGLPKTPW